MKKALIYIFLCCLCSQAQAQSLQGKIIDQLTGAGIPFASINIVGTNNASVSNENGEFILKSATFPAKLRVSHVSYLQTEIILNDKNESLIIKLKPASITLNEVTIDPYKGQRLLKAAIEKANENLDKTFYLSAFYRQLSTLNDKPNQIFELFYDLKWNVNRIQGWNAKQSRFAEIKDNISFTLNNQSLIALSYSGYLIRQKNGKLINLKDYQIDIEKYIEQGDQQIAVIACKYKKVKRNQYYVNSLYYIGVSDLKIYRLENNIYNLSTTITLGEAKYPPAVNTIATFSQNNGPTSILESVATNFLMNIKLKNGSDVFSKANSLLTVYKIDENLKNQNFEKVSNKTRDKKVIESIKYDPDFWKNNPIVKQTKLEDTFIKMMESKQAFGTMINP